MPMLTPAQVKAGYIVNPATGIVASPGKFEAEPAWVVALWDDVMHGRTDEDLEDNGVFVSVIHIDHQIGGIWPELRTHVGESVLLWEDSNGFVNSRIKTRAQVQAYIDACEDNRNE